MTRLVLVLLALLAFTNVFAREIPHLTFRGTYDEVGNKGDRMISTAFTYGGSTEVKRNFIRLTPDRQSRSGYVWSKDRVGRRELVIDLVFRISGQGKRWFGDGLALWLTHADEYQEGGNHGFAEKYYGIGVIIDTFKNTEHKGGHKDVTLQINDGTKTLDVINEEEKIGCDAAFRYHANSASFDPAYSSSRLRLKINGKELSLEIDPASLGTWEKCYMGTLPFPPNWLNKATVGVTASTGSLADNHDVIKMVAYENAVAQGLREDDVSVWTHVASKDFTEVMNRPGCDDECMVEALETFVKNFQVTTEHWLEDLKEKTKTAVAKLKEKEEMNHKKIKELMERIKKKMDTEVGKKMADIQNKVDSKIALDVEGEVRSAQSSWRLPFFFLLLALGGAGTFAYRKYQRLVKSHLL